MLRMVAENFGPLESVAIEQSPFMVFAGDHGTGKSYAARLFYALYSEFQGVPCIPFLPEAMFAQYRHFGDGVQADEMTWETYQELTSRVHASGHCLLSDIPVAHKFIESQLNESAVRDTILGAFDVMGAGVLRRWDQDADLRVSLTYTTDDMSVWGVNHIKRVKTEGASATDYQTWGMDYSVSQGDVVQFQSMVSGDVRVPAEHFASDIFDASTLRFFEGRAADALFLPDTRLGLLQLYKMLLSGTIDMATRGGRERAQQRLISPVTSFLESLIHYKVSDCFESIVEDLKVLLDGDVIAKSSFAVGIPSFYYAPASDPHRMRNFYQVSAFIASVAPILLAVRSGLHPGDLLVVEDVDMHLNDDQLATLCVILLRLSEMGVNVIVTTGDPHAFPQLGTDVRVWEFADGGATDITED